MGDNIKDKVLFNILNNIEFKQYLFESGFLIPTEEEFEYLRYNLETQSINVIRIDDNSNLELLDDKVKKEDIHRILDNIDYSNFYSVQTTNGISLEQIDEKSLAREFIGFADSYDMDLSEKNLENKYSLVSIENEDEEYVDYMIIPLFESFDESLFSNYTDDDFFNSSKPQISKKKMASSCLLIPFKESNDNDHRLDISRAQNISMDDLEIILAYQNFQNQKNIDDDRELLNEKNKNFQLFEEYLNLNRGNPSDELTVHANRTFKGADFYATDDGYTLIIDRNGQKIEQTFSSIEEYLNSDYCNELESNIEDIQVDLSLNYTELKKAFVLDMYEMMDNISLLVKLDPNEISKDFSLDDKIYSAEVPIVRAYVGESLSGERDDALTSFANISFRDELTRSHFRLNSSEFETDLLELRMFLVNDLINKGKELYQICDIPFEEKEIRKELNRIYGPNIVDPNNKEPILLNYQNNFEDCQIFILKNLQEKALERRFKELSYKYPFFDKDNASNMGLYCEVFYEKLKKENKLVYTDETKTKVDLEKTVSQNFNSFFDNMVRATLTDNEPKFLENNYAFRTDTFNNNIHSSKVDSVELKKNFDRQIEDKDINMILGYVKSPLRYISTSKELKELENLYDDYSSKYSEEVLSQEIFNKLTSTYINDELLLDKIKRENTRELNAFVEANSQDWGIVLKTYIENMDILNTKDLIIEAGEHTAYRIFKNEGNSYDMSILNTNKNVIYDEKTVFKDFSSDRVMEIIAGEEDGDKVLDDFYRHKLKDSLNSDYLKLTSGEKNKILYKDMPISDNDSSTEKFMKALAKGESVIFNKVSETNNTIQFYMLQAVDGQIVMKTLEPLNSVDRIKDVMDIPKRANDSFRLDRDGNKIYNDNLRVSTNVLSSKEVKNFLDGLNYKNYECISTETEVSFKYNKNEPTLEQDTKIDRKVLSLAKSFATTNPYERRQILLDKMKNHFNLNNNVLDASNARETKGATYMGVNTYEEDGVLKKEKNIFTFQASKKDINDLNSESRQQLTSFDLCLTSITEDGDIRSYIIKDALVFENDKLHVSKEADTITNSVLDRIIKNSIDTNKSNQYFREISMDGKKMDEATTKIEEFHAIARKYAPVMDDMIRLRNDQNKDLFQKDYNRFQIKAVKEDSDGNENSKLDKTIKYFEENYPKLIKLYETKNDVNFESLSNIEKAKVVYSFTSDIKNHRLENSIKALKSDSFVDTFDYIVAMNDEEKTRSLDAEIKSRSILSTTTAERTPVVGKIKEQLMSIKNICNERINQLEGFEKQKEREEFEDIKYLIDEFELILDKDINIESLRVFTNSNMSIVSLDESQNVKAKDLKQLIHNMEDIIPIKTSENSVYSNRRNIDSNISSRPGWRHLNELSLYIKKLDKNFDNLNDEQLSSLGILDKEQISNILKQCKNTINETITRFQEIQDSGESIFNNLEVLKNPIFSRETMEEVRDVNENRLTIDSHFLDKIDIISDSLDVISEKISKEKNIDDDFKKDLSEKTSDIKNDLDECFEKSSNELGD